MANFCVSQLVPERRERVAYFVPALYRLRRVWRVNTRKSVKSAKVVW